MYPAPKMATRVLTVYKKTITHCVGSIQVFKQTPNSPKIQTLYNDELLRFITDKNKN